MLQFVDGNDSKYQTQSQNWQKLHPDLARPQYDESAAGVRNLPPSWPPNFVMLAPEQQYAPARRKVLLLL